MEFYKISANGYELNVVFNGESYVFFNAWCGIAAVAERSEGDEKRFTTYITIYVGNQHLNGGSIGYRGMVPYVKRLVTKCENRYVPTKVEYNIEDADLSNWSARLEIVKR